MTSGLLQMLEWLWRVPGCPTGCGHIEGPSGHSIDGGFAHWPKMVPSNFLHCPVSLGCCDSGLHPEHPSSFSQPWYGGWLQLCQVLARSRDTAYFPLPKPVGKVTIQTWSTVAEQRAQGRFRGCCVLATLLGPGCVPGPCSAAVVLAGGWSWPDPRLCTLALIQPGISGWGISQAALVWGGFLVGSQSRKGQGLEDRAHPAWRWEVEQGLNLVSVAGHGEGVLRPEADALQLPDVAATPACAARPGHRQQGRVWVPGGPSMGQGICGRTVAVLGCLSGM